jgi:hypothetical protein
MNATTLGISFLAILSVYIGYVGWTKPEITIPQNPITPWGENTGKTHHIQSKHGDASMMTELRRRQAIQQVGRLDKHKLKESRTQFGSTTGAMETLMLSGICPPLPCPIICPSDIIYDAGGQTDEFCPILDAQASGAILDAGGESDEFCPILDAEVSGVTLDAGNRGDNLCPIVCSPGSGILLDAGNQNTKACGV